MELGRGSPILLACQNLGDVVPAIYRTAGLTQDRVKPDGIANRDKVGLVGDIQTEAVTLGGSCGHVGVGQGLSLGGRIQIQIIDHSSTSSMGEQREIRALQGIRGASSLVDHFISLIEYADLAIGKSNRTDQSCRVGIRGGHINVGGVITRCDDIHVVLARKHPLLQRHRSPSSRPACLVGVIDLNTAAGGIKGDPQTVAGAIGDLTGVVADITAPDGVQPCAVTYRYNGPVHRELRLLVVLHGRRNIR